jgi:hypothetical protein
MNTNNNPKEWQPSQAHGAEQPRHTERRFWDTFPVRRSSSSLKRRKERPEAVADEGVSDTGLFDRPLRRERP